MEEEIKRLAITVAKSKRRQCSCYMSLCGDCQDASLLLELLNDWDTEPQEGTYQHMSKSRSGVVIAWMEVADYDSQ